MTSKPFDTGHAYKTAKWLVHYSVAAAIVLGCVCLGLTGVIIALLPLKQVQPFLVTTHSKSEQLITLEPLTISQEATDNLIDSLVRNYVMLREAIDLQSEKHRYDHVLKFSEDALAKAFYDLYDEKNPKSPFVKFKGENVTRAVIIHNSACLAPSAPDVWQVEWESIDSKDGKEIGRARWVSTLTAALDKQEISYDDKFLNPVGFQVKQYTVSKKG